MSDLASNDVPLQEASARLLSAAMDKLLEHLQEADEVNDFVRERSIRFAQYCPGGEHELEWTEAHMDYCELVERAIHAELAVLGCTEDALLGHALHGYSSDDPLADSWLHRLLARTDYEKFCAMMHAEHLDTVRAAIEYREHGDEGDGEYAAVEEAWAEGEDGELGEEADEDLDERALEAALARLRPPGASDAAPRSPGTSEAHALR